MSEYVDVTPELMAGFLDEAPEYLAMLDDGLMAFEERAGAEGITLDDPEDQERMTTMFRAAHSLKGLAATMGFDKIRDLTHLMETLFDHIRMGKRVLDAATIEALFGVFDKLRGLVNELSDTPDEAVTIHTELKTLEGILGLETVKRPSAGPSSAGDAGPSAQRDAKAPQGTPAAELTNEFAADAELLQPTTTVPSADVASALLVKLPPGRSPRPTSPPPEVQRNA